MTQIELQNLTLIEIEKLLNKNNRRLRQFPTLPYLDNYVIEQVGNKLIHAELDYDVDDVRLQFENYFQLLTGVLIFILLQSSNSIMHDMASFLSFFIVLNRYRFKQNNACHNYHFTTIIKFCPHFFSSSDHMVILNQIMHGIDYHFNAIIK